MLVHQLDIIPAAKLVEDRLYIGIIEVKKSVLPGHDLIDIDGSGGLCLPGIEGINGLLAGPAIQRIDDSPIERLFMTDSVETQPVELSPKIEMVSVAGLLGEAIRRIARRESISVLFS